MRDAKAVITLFVLLVLALSLTGGIFPVQAITWGTEDTTNIYENVGTVVFYHLVYEDYFLLCSGTLIYEGDDNSYGAVFLTAAHCTYYLELATDQGIIDPEEIYVSFDPLDPLNVDTWYTVTEIHSHPDYNPITNRPDVGVLVLDGHVDDITPAALPEEGFLDDLRRERTLRPKGSTGAYFTVAGYGGVLEWPPPVITYPDTRSYAYSQFQALLKTQLLLSQNYAKSGNGGTCFGDSGGPVFWEPTNGERTLVAVTSWGDANCIAAGFYYRIDTSEALDFIDQYMP